MRLNCWLLTRDPTSGTITSRQIVDLPQYGRDPYQLLRQIEGRGRNAVSETAGTRTAWVIPPFWNGAAMISAPRRFIFA
jgi:hypothetical protein